MTDFREQVFQARDENTLKRLASRIPGYGGYLEKEMRRDADKMLRDFIAAQLEQQRKRIAEAQLELLSAPGGLDLMDDVDRVQKKLQLLIDRLRVAVYGYAGWFDAVTIREQELDALYSYDRLLLDGVETIDAQAQAFVHAVAGDGELKPAMAALRDTLNGLHEHVDRRKDVLTGALPVPAAPVAPPAPPAEPPTPPATDTSTGS
jgi:hypothetical protein